MDDALELADWRRRTAALYLDGPAEGADGAAAWRRGRDALFGDHPQSPLPAEARAGFAGLRYWPYDEDAVVTAALVPPADDTALEIETGGEDGLLRYRRTGRVTTPWGELTLFWLLGYGGGLFLPFRDATCGQASYGGGGGLPHTTKGTLGPGGTAGPGRP